MEEEGKYNWLEIACNLQLLDSHCLSMANEFSPVSLGALLFFAVVMIEGTQWTAIFYVNVNTRLERNCFQHSRNISEISKVFLEKYRKTLEISNF